MNELAELPQEAKDFSRRNRTGLTSNAEEVSDLVGELIDEMSKQRCRALSSSQKTELEETMTCLILDLLSVSICSEKLWIGYSRGKRNFVSGGCYWNNELGQPFISYTYLLASIEYLVSVDLIQNFPAQAGDSEYSSRLKPTKKLKEKFSANSVDWTCIVESEQTPSIIVKDANKIPTTWPDPEGFDLHLALSRLNRINDNLRKSFINLNISDEDLNAINSKMLNEGVEFTEEFVKQPIDFSQRQLRRIFAMNSFTHAGRFYGGWFQSIPSKFRKFIEINGNATVELDYSTIQPRMLYATVNLQPPDDSYILPGWSNDLRKVGKKAFSQLLNSSESSRNPNQWHRFAPSIKPEPLPEGWYDLSAPQKNKIRRQCFLERTGRDYSEFIQDLLDFHKPIQKDLFSGVWSATQNFDSEVVERVLIKLLDADVPITALPIHDSFIVPIAAREALRLAMNEAYNEVIQSDIRIDDDDTILDELVPNDNPVVVANEALHEAVRSHMISHRSYHLREAQWVRRFGPID